MGWVRVSDDFYDHGAHSTLELEAWGLWLWSLAWSNRNLSDGVIPWPVAKRMDPDGKASGALIDAGRWLDHGCVLEVHDFLEYQPSAEQVRAKRLKERERWQRRADSESPPRQLHAVPDATPPASQPQPQHLSTTDESARKRSKRKPGVAIPIPFTPDESVVAFAAREYPNVDLRQTTQAMVDWALENDARKVDWQRTLKGFVRRNHEQQQRGGRW